MKKQIILLFALGLFFGPATTAQQNGTKPSLFTSVDEAVFLHANTNTLLTGENFYYSFYCWNIKANTFSNISKIGYVELVNAQGETVLKQKINLEHGLGNGDFFVPTSLQTGNYKIVAYTRWMLNQPISEFFKMDVFIINPFLVPPKKMLSTDADSLGAKPIATIHIENKENANWLSNTVYRPREKISFDLNSNNDILPGNYSVSIRKVDNLAEKESMRPQEFINSLNERNQIQAETWQNNNHYLPELRGELIVGKIENLSETENVSRKNVALSLPGKNFAFKISQTDATGKFRFILDSVPNSSQAVLQIMGTGRENYRLHLENTTIDYGKLRFGERKLNPKMRAALEERSVALQIENAYFYKKQDSLLPMKTSFPFYHPLAKEYVLDKYTSFPKLEETIIEIIPEMYVAKKNGERSIHLRDYYNESGQNLFGETLVLVDGLLVQDVEPFFGYDARKIEKVSIVPRAYIYGPKIFEGVANFSTKGQDFKTAPNGEFYLETTLLRPKPKKEYFNPQYGSKTKNKRIPDYRYQLLWIPKISLSENEKTIDFFTSDVEGKFEIILEGFTQNGKPVYRKQVFEVR